MDLSLSMELSDNITSAVGSLRTNTTETFKTMYIDVEKKMSLGIIISISQLALNRTNRFSILKESPEVYFRILVFIPFFRKLL